MSREIRHVHREPLDAIWLAAARSLGFRVVRTAEVNAAYDGAGTILLGTPETLDPDDTLAQLVLHELCHRLVEGEDAASQADWGLDQTSDRDVPREHACLRVQACLADRHGLRRVLAPTTDFRAFYDALPAWPLDSRGESSVEAARRGLSRADEEPFHSTLEEALAATATLARAARPFLELFDGDPPSLLREVEEPVPSHPSGLPGRRRPEGSCGTCAWHWVGGRGRPVDRCRQAADRRVDPSWPGCERHEVTLDCRSCAACCREAYPLVVVSPRDPVVARHPDLVVADGLFTTIAREGERCAALVEGDSPGAHACRIYDDRPRPCRELEVGGPHCLVARRRVGLSG